MTRKDRCVELCNQCNGLYLELFLATLKTEDLKFLTMGMIK